MDLHSLKTSITELPLNEAEALVQKLRKNRRISKRKVLTKRKTTTVRRTTKKPKTPQELAKQMSPQQREALLKLLEG